MTVKRVNAHRLILFSYMRMWNKTWNQIFLRMIDNLKCTTWFGRWNIIGFNTYAVSRKIIRTSTLQEIWHDEIGISFWEMEKLIEFHFTVVVICSIYEHSKFKSTRSWSPWQVLFDFCFSKKPEPVAQLVNCKRKRYV